MDSSSLVKLYVDDEDGVAETRAAVTAAHEVWTSPLAYAEVRSALAKAHRAQRLTAVQLRRAASAFDVDWPIYRAVEPTDGVLRAAGDASERHPLSGADALHLASGLALHSRLPGEPVHLTTWDKRLWDAAQADGLTLSHRRPA